MFSAIGIILFLVSIVIPEILRRKTVPIQSSWISTYLTGPDGWMEDVGFTLLALALWLYPTGNWGLDVGGICVFLSMFSRRFFPYFISNAQLVTRLHVLSSGLAFLFAGLSLLYAGTWLSVYILIATLLIDLYIYLVKDSSPDKIQYIEKISTVGIGLAGLAGLL